MIVAESEFETLDRAITAGEAYGLAKLVAELTAWVARGEKRDDVSRVVHAYPTYAEGPACAADQHLAARCVFPRVRALTRPILTTLRVLERAR